MPTKICMIGCGAFARLCHGPAQKRYAASHADVALAACCDHDEARAREFRATFGYQRHYPDAHHMLDSERPDVVVLAVPPSATFGAALPIMARRFPLLLEKPPGMTPAELDRMIQATALTHVPVQVCFNRRYMPVLIKAREILCNEFGPGEVTTLDYEMIRSDRWNEDFSTTAVHAFDAMLFLVNEPLERAEFTYESRHQGGNNAMDVIVRARSRSGTRLRAAIRPVSGRIGDTIRIHGVGRSMVISVPASPALADIGTLEFWKDGKLRERFSDERLEMIERMGIYGELETFVQRVLDSEVVEPALIDCRQQVALMHAMREQLPDVAFAGPRLEEW